MRRVANATRRVKNEKFDNDSPGKHDHEQFLYRYFLVPRPENRQTNSQSTPKKKKKTETYIDKDGAARAMGADAVEIGTGDPFKDGHWNNAGASRLLGQECDDTQATQQKQMYDGHQRETGRTGGFDRSLRVAFYCSATESGRVRAVANRNFLQDKNQKDKREGGCRFKSMKSRSQQRRRPEGISSSVRQGRP